ncbi:DNA polymerase III subunit alpha [Auraticoccus monumenti]|uniref:DNA polymerase III subunit alpha n=1 Tax=Auraticoccus monumenti TaxID=675864 RepID=A0A1G7DP65_9ACTN|nr:DNA polymerase III subunit alpha [Auraticoccus monumenti]SDE53219.1 DNA polymerase III, alpha subunit [Auraticoccus monumenti]
MDDPFVHLRVASGYSLRHGASHPAALVRAAAEAEMDTLALTDRDGLYGAVRFAGACLQTGIAPVLGVDLAVPPELVDAPPQATRTRQPVRGGAVRDAGLPRVVVLASSPAGWGRLCRLVSATHLSGQRGEPVCSTALLAEHAASGDLVVLLGGDSELGRLVAEGRDGAAEESLRRWRLRLAPGQLVLAATSHRMPGRGVGSLSQAARMVAMADHHRVPVVLTNAVRMAERRLAPTLDVLDSARRLVPLSSRNVDRRNAEGYLKTGKEMLEVAHEVAARAGRDERGAGRLVADTRQLALRCRLDPRADLGLGSVHLPELEVLDVDASGVRRSGAPVGELGMQVLRDRCEAGLAGRYGSADQRVRRRLEDELATIASMGYASYFLTVADVVTMIKAMGVRCAARGSGAGSLVNYLLGISGIDPLRHGLLMERFLSPLRQALPDIDLDVESARRLDIYRQVLATFGGERVACVAMMDTYRVRHAVRDVGAALSLPPAEVDAIAKAFPHVRARDARAALRDLPELRAAGLGERRLEVLFSLVESLDGLPRHVALHPCGILLSDATLLDRTPVEASHDGFPMSQFDKDDVEEMGFLKLDLLGIRMQSSMAHAVSEISRTEGVEVDVDALSPFDDEPTYDMIGKAATLGCFQIESPGQRELVGKFGPSTFDDIIIDISLFRPGPVKSEMVTPFLEARQGWREPVYPHPDLEPFLAPTGGVVVFHEQVIQIISVMTGCTLAEGDEKRRALGDREGQRETRAWFEHRARRRGYDEAVIARIWAVLEAFASFGFCKAHAAAFALPTYQSAWLKAHWPAHFLAGVLTHDPGMYPKRLILEEARRLGVAILGLDVNESRDVYRVEQMSRLDEPPPSVLGQPSRLAPGDGLPDGRPWGIRISLADVSGISESEVASIIAGQPYHSVSDFWFRARVSHSVAERLVLAGGFDSLYGIGSTLGVRRRQKVTRRDLLLAVADLQRNDSADARTRSRARGLRRASLPTQAHAALSAGDPAARAGRQSRAAAQVQEQDVQLPLDFTDPEEASDAPDTLWAEEGEPEALDPAPGPDRFPDAHLVASGLPELTEAERVRAELNILGLDVSRHVVEFYRPLLIALGVCDAADLLKARSRSELLVAGVKVATQTPPVRSGRRVVFLTLDDSTGPLDATFFEDAQGHYAGTVFSSWMLVVRGVLRRTGPRGVSLRATGCWDLQQLHQVWQEAQLGGADPEAALDAVRAVIADSPDLSRTAWQQEREAQEPTTADDDGRSRAGGMGQRRVLVHASGFRQSPYADIKPAGESSDSQLRKLWHTSSGSSGR